MAHKKKSTSKVLDEQIASISSLFSILSNPQRIKILWLLKNKKSLSVHHIQEELSISQSNVSQHLSVLKMHKLVYEERKGKEVYYSLTETKKLSKVLASAIHFISYQLASNSELLTTCEVLSFWA